MKANQNIITRHLPKTQQTTMYAAGDDGIHEAGWWRLRVNANNRFRWIRNTPAPFSWIVLDRATGLMWAADGTGAGCGNGVQLSWVNAIAFCNGLNFSGFSDWRLPNVKELQSIINFELLSPKIDEPPFSNTFALYYWSSTTHSNLTSNAYRVNFGLGIVTHAPKERTHNVRPCRKMV